MSEFYRFDSKRFADDVIKKIEDMGWDEFRYHAKTTDKVMLRAMMWSQGTISAQTVAKFCNIMRKSPLLYYKPINE